MPRRKIPEDAFSFYFGLGPGRSYQTVAEKYGVTKRAVTKLAARERWQARLLDLERKARDRSDQQKVDALEAIHERHLKALRLIQGKALEALRQMPIESAMDAVRALGISIREERVAVGEPSERTAISVEDTIRREYERWMVVGEEPGEVASQDGGPSEPRKSLAE